MRFLFQLLQGAQFLFALLFKLLLPLGLLLFLIFPVLLGQFGIPFCLLLGGDAGLLGLPGGLFCGLPRLFGLFLLYSRILNGGL